MTDITSLKQEVKELQEKHQNQKLSEQMSEIRSMASELSALTKKNSGKKYPAFTNDLDPDQIQTVLIQSLRKHLKVNPAHLGMLKL